MLKTIKRRSFSLGKRLGAFHLVGGSGWRRQRLLILCYHGISLEREHEWHPALFMQPSEFERRLAIIQRTGCSVLPLAEGIRRVYAGDLPERSVAITFDDGNYDFYARAYPLLQDYGFPATVYLTTYYSDHEHPVFHLICSYVLWKRRGTVVPVHSLLGAKTTLDLRTPEARRQALNEVVGYADREGLSATEKNRLARSLADLLGEDHEELWSKRVLQLMNAAEVAELSAAGVDFQLHTHRHRTPDDPPLFQREIQDNRASIRAKTQSDAVHFCYPSGVYKTRFLPWLREEGVTSATTCEPGFASPASDPLLLPRLVDHTGLAPVEFEGWLTGFASLIPQKRKYAHHVD